MTASLHSGVTLSISDIITIVGIAVTLASIGWAVYERGQRKKAHGAADRFRKLLVKQQLASQFTDVPGYALTLFRQVRSHDWAQAAEASLLLSAKLASLSGVEADLVGGTEREHLETALQVMGVFNHRLTETDALSLEVREKMLEACNVLVLSTHALETSLRLRAAMGADE